MLIHFSHHCLARQNKDFPGFFQDASPMSVFTILELDCPAVPYDVMDKATSLLLVIAILIS